MKQTRRAWRVKAMAEWGCFGFHHWIYAKYPEKPGRKCQRCGRKEKPRLRDNQLTWISEDKSGSPTR